MRDFAFGCIAGIFFLSFLFEGSLNKPGFSVWKILYWILTIPLWLGLLALALMVAIGGIFFT